MLFIKCRKNGFHVETLHATSLPYAIYHCIDLLSMRRCMHHLYYLLLLVFT